MNDNIARELMLIAQRLIDLASRLETKTDAVASPKPNEQAICTNCGSPIPKGTRPVRGAHYRCYRKLNRLIHDGLITEEEVIQSGKLLPPLPGGRNPSTTKLDYVASIKEEARQLAEKVKELSRSKAKQE